MASNETKTLFSSEDPSGRVIGMDSNIINDEKLYEDLMNLCDFGDQKWKLVYRASRDGFAAKDFHSKCDDVCNTLTIIKTTNSSIFGGFKLRPIFRENTFIHDSFAVVFSLANKQKKPLLFKLVDEEKAVKYAKNFGPCFGNGDIAITGDSNLSSTSSFCVGTSYQSCCDAPYEYVKEEQLQTIEIEVFQKQFNELTENQMRRIKQETKLPETKISGLYGVFDQFAVNGVYASKTKLEKFFKTYITENYDDDNVERSLCSMNSYFEAQVQKNFSFKEFLKIFDYFDERDHTEIDEFQNLQIELLLKIGGKEAAQIFDLNTIREFLRNLNNSSMMEPNVISRMLGFVVSKLEEKPIDKKYFTRDEFFALLKSEV